MSFLTLPSLFLCAAALMALGNRVFLSGASHLGVHFRSLYRPERQADPRFFSAGVLSGAFCSAETVRELLWLEDAGRIAPRACFQAAVGACLPFWLPLAALLPFPCGALMILAGLVLAVLPQRSDLPLLIGRMLSGLGCFAAGAGFLRVFGAQPALSVQFFTPSPLGSALFFLLGVCAGFLSGSAGIPCSVAVIAAGFHLVPVRTVLLFLSGVFAGAALYLPVTSSAGHPWTRYTVRALLAQHGFCAFLLITQSIPIDDLPIYREPITAAIIAIACVCSSLFMLFYSRLIKPDGVSFDGPGPALPAAGYLPGLDLPLAGAELTLLGQLIRGLIARPSQPEAETDAGLSAPEPESIAERCRSVHLSCIGVLGRNPSPREARLCSLFQVFASCYLEILQNAELPGSGVLPDDSDALRQAVVDMLDQSICAMNEVCLGHPFDAAFLEDIRALLDRIRSLQTGQPETAQWCLALERILLGVLRLAECAGITAMLLQETAPDNPFK